jgi:hypothetical protein
MVGADGSGGAEVGDGGIGDDAKGELSNDGSKRSNSMQARGHA